ncbi:hypothetical protein FF38_06025, partial [Lucilia cuprina]
LREAASDTPSFRASVLTSHEQILKFEAWLNELESATSMIAKRVETLKDTVKGYCGGPPPFVQKSIVDNDSIALLLGRFGEAHMRYWSGLVSQTTENANQIRKMSSISYWSEKLDKDHTTDLMHNLGLLPNDQTILRRAIYDKDIENALLTGGFWNQTSQNLCTNKFSHLVSISSNIENFFPVYDYEQSIIDTTQEIETLRLDYALKRNELMTDIWILNAQEKEKIQEIYRSWLINETMMCSKVRPYLSILNASVYDNIHDYCISCLEEAKMLL